MKRYDSEKIRKLNEKIKERLRKLNYNLSNRAETHHYYTVHGMDFKEELEADDKNAVKSLKEITKLHEELFEAELEWAIANREES